MEPEQPVVEQHDTQQAPEMAPFVPPHKGSPIKRVLLIVIGLAVLAALVLAGIKLLHKTPKPAQVSTSSTNAQTNKSTSVTRITSATTHYDSTNFSLGFDYPKDWTVSDTDGARLTVTSPILQLKDSNGQTTNARIVFAVQHQQSNIPQLAANHAVAPIRSQKIAYTSATPSQRAQTYVTFVNYTGGSQGIDALYITGDNGYQAAQTVPMSDIAHDDPLVTISFLRCADTTCPATSSPMPIATSSWQDSALSTPLINLLKSLAID